VAIETKAQSLLFLRRKVASKIDRAAANWNLRTDTSACPNRRTIHHALPTIWTSRTYPSANTQVIERALARHDAGNACRITEDGVFPLNR